jgi:hypothetical protein
MVKLEVDSSWLQTKSLFVWYEATNQPWSLTVKMEISHLDSEKESRAKKKVMLTVNASEFYAVGSNVEKPHVKRLSYVR